MTERSDPKLAGRRALEALRNGVPNQAAVEILGCRQPAAETAFTGRLTRAAESDGRSGDVSGVLFSGNFGSGKSHLLTHLERLALSRGFVCSRVAISKETPLYDLGKVFKSAVENARMPGRQGRMIEELLSALDWKSERSARFFQWADATSRTAELSRMFPASLLVYERLGDPEINSRIESFWAGDRIRVADVNEGLRQIGQKKNYSFRAPRAADLPPQRLRFATALIRAAGYRGWVILLDEIELIGYYSLLQRGRSYAELARWLEPAAGDACPGLVAAGTVIDAFYLDVISPDGKQDCDYVGPRMEASRHADLAARAETGMRLLHDQRCIPLERSHRRGCHWDHREAASDLQRGLPLGGAGGEGDEQPRGNAEIGCATGFGHPSSSGTSCASIPGARPEHRGRRVSPHLQGEHRPGTGIPG